MRLSRVVVVMSVVLFSSHAFAQIAYFQAAQAAEEQTAKFAEDLAALRKDAFDAKKADEFRDRLTGKDGITKQFAAAMTELHDAKQKLMVNKDANKDEIAALEQAEQRAEAAKKKLTKLGSLMPDDATMISQVRSGTLQRTASEVSAAMKQAAAAIADVQGKVTATGDDKPGSIEFKKIEVKGGKVRFFVNDGSGEKEVFEGSTIKVTKFPIALRASIQDSEKVRLDQQWGTGGATWDPKPTAPGPGHFYAYEGAGGRSEWTAREEYHWSAGDNKDRLRSIGQRNSDDSTKKATGDIVELVPAKAIAQGVGLDLDAKSLKWERKSKLAAGERKQDVTPKDAAATAHLVISIYPAGNN